MISTDIALWSAEHCAEYLLVSKKVFIERYSANPSFPKRIKVPNGTGGYGHPRWLAREVIEWAESFKEK